MTTCDNKSVGAIIRRDGKILLLERKKFPFGFAPPAGHMDDHGSFEDAARDEVKEEVGLEITNIKLVAQGRKENKCRREGGAWHEWRVYEAEVNGELSPSPEETKTVGWYDQPAIAALAGKTEAYLAGQISEECWQTVPGLEPVWLEWFKELGVLP